VIFAYILKPMEYVLLFQLTQLGFIYLIYNPNRNI